MRIVLVARDNRLHEAWGRYCGDLEGVEVHAGSILEVPCDAVVSPANSFGFMDGGIDLIYSLHFGWHVQERLQAHIREHHQGELLVGAAEIVETDDERIPFLIAAPTMRVPMILGETVAPYLAARGALLLVKEGRFRSGPRSGSPVREGVTSIAFPGLGTGVGRVPADACARQVRAAIEDVRAARTFPATWMDAQERHRKLLGRQAGDLQLEDSRSGAKLLRRWRARFERLRRRR